MNDEIELRLREWGYVHARRLPSGLWLAVKPQLLTTALCLDIDEQHGAYRTRFCYENRFAAVLDFAVWDGDDDPPGNWIKQKPEDRMNPNWLAAARRDMHG
jgi:hypothetical protein